MSSLVDFDLVRAIQGTDNPRETGNWPGARLECLRRNGVFEWGLPSEFGGRELTAAQHLNGYIQLARACLTTAFIMTQRDAACHRIASSANADLQQRLMPDLVSGRTFATVGISHLSTSRQHWSKPSVTATPTSNGYELNGEAPWVTGGTYADVLVTGGVLPNGEQLLVALPRERTGLRFAPPLELVALNASFTGSVILDRVLVSLDDLIAGPVPQVMKVGATGGTGSLTTSAVAIGAASHTIDQLLAESSKRSDLQNTVEQLSYERDQLRADLLTAADTVAASENRQPQSERIRFLANSLSLRAALAFVCYAKGAGFLAGHPAEVALRESLFFQVWSCPPAVTTRSISQFISSASHSIP